MDVGGGVCKMRVIALLAAVIIADSIFIKYYGRWFWDFIHKEDDDQ